jgi:hypothetical protein
MAGYIMNLSSLDSLKDCFKRGVYSTYMRVSTTHWKVHHEGTVADYATMKQGDNIYFFIKRKIYGIGELVNIGLDCKFRNFPDANIPKSYSYTAVKESSLLDIEDSSQNYRWICTFKPSPYFFRNGVDMDDVLSSKPASFRSLRAFWKLSFIKIDDEENKALKDFILKTNQDSIQYPSADDIFATDFLSVHNAIKPKIDTGNYHFNVSEILDCCASGDSLSHEMALEVGLLHQLTRGDEHTVNVFGSWDYLSHQVIASPFKPIDYMDKMDVFGYAYIPGFEAISRYLVAELKRGTAELQDVEQLMKYVDFINAEYAYGDYSMIHAFLVAHNFSDTLVNELGKIGLRRYITGMRPAQSKQWSNIKLVKYRYNPRRLRLEFEEI